MIEFAVVVGGSLVHHRRRHRTVDAAPRRRREEVRGRIKGRLLSELRRQAMTERYEQLELFELTETICATAQRIADGEIVNAADKLDLAEQMYEARRRMPATREYGNWWRTTKIGYRRDVARRAGTGRRADCHSMGVPTCQPTDGSAANSRSRRFAEIGRRLDHGRRRRRRRAAVRQRALRTGCLVHAAVGIRRAGSDVRSRRVRAAWRCRVDSRPSALQRGRRRTGAAVAGRRLVQSAVLRAGALVPVASPSTTRWRC